MVEGHSQEGQRVKCTPLSSVEPENGFNVLFADCEGCLPKFIEENTAIAYIKVYTQISLHVSLAPRLRTLLAKLGMSAGTLVYASLLNFGRVQGDDAGIRLSLVQSRSSSSPALR